ncbi:MAG: EamA/RhaT family transporter, partial [Dongiaceae bacterium]
MTAADPAVSARPLWQAALPGLFVVLWASGFVVTKLGVAFAEPFIFLFIRFAVTAGLMLAIALAMRAPWPRSRAELGHIAVVGVLLQAAYL